MSPNPPPHPQRLVELLRDGKGPLVARWCHRVLLDPAVPEANRLSMPLLQDHIPDLIDRLVESLERHSDSNGHGEATGRRIGHERDARAHARERFDAGYSLPAAMRELSHFRAALVDLCEAEGVAVTAEEAKLVHAAIDEAMSLAAEEIHRAAEARVRRSEAKYRRLVESDVVGVMVAHLDGRIVEANDAFLAMVGFTGRDVQSGELNWTTMTPPEWEPADAQMLAALKSTGSSQPTEKEFLDAQGDRVPVLVAGAALEDNEQAIVFVLDLRERKRTEDSLRRDAALRERFLGILSHDLKQPLGAVAFSTDALLRLDGLSPEQLRWVQRIGNSARRMERLISDLLDLVRTRQGSGIPLTPRVVDLADLCAHVVEEITTVHPDRDVHFVRTGNCQGFWDPDRLAQLVSNLVTNALAYSPAGTVVRLEIDGHAAHHLTLCVHNHGEPIPPELLPVIFDPFRRGNHMAPRGSTSAGLGLGLNIADAIARAHGGSIAVRSDATHGTTFAVQLPREGPGAVPTNDSNVAGALDR